jgi:DNA-binding NarL/FixJ family response regulator
MKLHILVVDDHALLRQGCCLMLKNHDPEWRVSEAGDGKEAVILTGKLHPDVILMDYFMPRMNGEKAALKIRKLYPEVQIIMVSMEITEEMFLQTMTAGVRGFVPKEGDGEELLEAIHTVVSGKYYFSPKLKEMTRKKEEFIIKGNKINADLFTSREREVLFLLGKDYTSSMIAEKLVISKRTVDHHRTSLLAKSGSQTTAGLIRFAYKAGMLGR